MNEKKSNQLGINHSTASHRLVKDLLWSFIKDAGRDICFRCAERMSRDTFSIEHISPWLDSENPKESFFNLQNITYSHKTCNYKNGRKSNKKYFTKEERTEANRRIWREGQRRIYTTERRREKMRRSGW